MKTYYIALLWCFLSLHIFCQQNENTWETKTPMQIKRAFHSMAVSQGKIYVIGGVTGSSSEFKATTSVEMYDPSSNRWSSKAEMPVTGILSCAVTVQDKIFVVGGEEGGSFAKAKISLVYDCNKDTWAKKASMNIARSFHSAVTLNNKIYAIGGRENNQEINTKPKDSLAVYTIEEYDIAADKWIIKAVLPFKHFTIGAAVINNKIYILSDTTNNSMLDESAILEEYNPEDNTFHLKAKLKPSKCDAAMTVYNNRLYVFGGWYNGALSTVEEYDPITDKWSEKPRMPYVIQNHQAVAFEDKIYISGGINYLADGKNDKKANLLMFNMR